MDDNLETQKTDIDSKEDKLANSAGNFDVEKLKEELLHIMVFYLSKTPEIAIQQDWLHAVTILVRGHTFSELNKVKKSEKEDQPKFVNYLSMEFLVGRTLHKSIIALGLGDIIEEILKGYGLSLQELVDVEPEPGLGNGGLGRLAACFMDSLAALEIPSFGYGIRYDYGMFTQRISGGQQVEVPDMWLLNSYMWEIHRPEVKYLVPFSDTSTTDDGTNPISEEHNIYARAYDILIPSYKSRQISRLRLWSAATTEELVLDFFNVGDYARAFYEKNNAENLSSVLYPDDRSQPGKELRLKQEYFFSSASIQDIIFRFTRNHHDFADFPRYQAIHLNDTHPALAIPEFLRVLTAHYAVKWADAWRACQKTFSYTNHTLLPEALETWGVKELERIVPKILSIIYQINQEFLNAVRSKVEYDNNFLSRVSLIGEGHERKVRMANLAVVASHKINGVSRLHGSLMKKEVFKDFYQLFPDRFTSITNGVTPRRWIVQANPKLSKLITARIGDGWKKDLREIEKLKGFAKDDSFKQDFYEVKQDNKEALADYIKRRLGVVIDINSLFDVQVKRIHEYKRQMLNIFYVIHRYNAILANPRKSWIPRTFIISGKAASAYYMAKLIIRFINDVAQVINNDGRTNNLLKVVFVPNYSVRLAELIIPAADISEQISVAGMEASGTGNMKFSMNGALTVGTYDGANIEIMEAVGEDNFFLFGNSAKEISAIRKSGYDPFHFYESNQSLRKIITQIRLGFFSPNDEKRYTDLVNNLLHSDNFMVLPDFDSYLAIQEKVDLLYANQDLWLEKAITCVASMGSFSSDDTIRNYAKNIWHVKYAN